MHRFHVRAALTVAAAAFALAACGSSSKPASSAATPTTAAPTTEAPTTTAPAAGKATVATATNATIGKKILVDSSGMTLYVWDNDKTAGTSSCTGQCAAAWPPLKATGTPTYGAGRRGSLMLASPVGDVRVPERPDPGKGPTSRARAPGGGRATAGREQLLPTRRACASEGYLTKTRTCLWPVTTLSCGSLVALFWICLRFE